MRAIKVLYNAVKSLNSKKLVKLAQLTIPHPLLSILALYATLKTFSIAQKLYPKSASNNGRGNAFRHALWNCLIMMYCCKITSPMKAYDYCVKMTTMHEELFPNDDLEKKMDLHNNKIGLNFFMQLLPGVHRQFFETNFFIAELQQMTDNAIILQDIQQELDNRLVYLKN